MRVAAVQTTAGPDRTDNLEMAATLVHDAVADGARLVVLPEYFSVAGSPSVMRERAESLIGPTVTWASDLARTLGVHLVAGTFPERPDPSLGFGERLCNTSCLLGPSGNAQAVYRKVHLFDSDLGGSRFRESATFAPGRTLSVSTLGVSDGRGSSDTELGMSICYDLRFPELYRILTLRGATVISVPSAFTAATGADHWELLVRARAVENQVFMIAAAQVGTPPSGMPDCFGHSMIVDPWGKVLACRTDQSPGVVTADLDFARLREVRAQLPVLVHRRPDAYGWPHEHGQREIPTGR